MLLAVRTWFKSLIEVWVWPRFPKLSYLNEVGNGFLVNNGANVKAETFVLGILKAL